MVQIREEKDVLEFLKSRRKGTLQGFETLGGFNHVVSRQFSQLFNSYTQAFNKFHKRKGSFFIPNFKRRLINSENYFGTLIAYIHTNPVYHGFTQFPGEWPHSSWYAYLSNNKQTNINRKVGIE